ncbi:MAG: hypothetical protein OET90_09120 [Desulfuromonadales bacterium]|nr:hypothetical protein [Desulfuromonadales bacterium]
MKCSFCEHELTEEMLRQESCGGCIGGCRKIHCPYCGKENDMPAALLEKLFRTDKS